LNNTDKAEEYHVRNGDHEKTIIMKLPKTYEEQVNILVPPTKDMFLNPHHQELQCHQELPIFFRCISRRNTTGTVDLKEIFWKFKGRT